MTAIDRRESPATASAYASRDQQDPGDADFTIDFADPSDAELSWSRDDMHMPFALTPLAGDFVTDGIAEGFRLCYEHFGGKQEILARIWHGWAYFAHRSGVAEAEEKAQEERFIEIARRQIPVTLAYWNDEALPEIRATLDWMQRLPVEELPAEELAAAWESAWRKVLRLWLIHFITVQGPYQVLDDLVDAYQAAVGTGREGEALSLTAGGHRDLDDVEEGIQELTALAGPVDGDLVRAIEALAAEGDATDPAEMVNLDRLAAYRGGSAFVDALLGFLERHGHLGQNHDDLLLASWAEAPRQLLARLVTRFHKPVPPARERESALRRRAEELADGARAALAGKPDELARFETLLAQARQIGWLTEGHNYWIDRMSQARLRRLALRVGGRLARAGVIPTPLDVFHLNRDEVAAALRDAHPRHDLVARRRAEHERNERRHAPYYVGKVPEKREGDRFDGPRVVTTEPDRLKGTGASAGVARGRARLTLAPDDFGRIQPGDIIVCPSSNPSWVPVFAIAGGLVTNTGGVLSHAAVVAREFGLPAVVGTGDATTKIADGRLVEIDGTAGTVALL